MLEKKIKNFVIGHHPLQKSDNSEITLCTKNCEDCIHMAWVDGTHRDIMCIYILHTAQRRPCGAGDGCTVKEKQPEDFNKQRRQRYADTLRYGKGLYHPFVRNL